MSIDSILDNINIEIVNGQKYHFSKNNIKYKILLRIKNKHTSKTITFIYYTFAQSFESLKVYKLDVLTVLMSKFKMFSIAKDKYLYDVNEIRKYLCQNYNVCSYREYDALSNLYRKVLNVFTGEQIEVLEKELC